MPRSAGFWSWYASASDNVRHEVIERGWYGREVTADIDARDMPALQEAEPAVHPDELYGHSPEPPQEQQEPEP